MAQTGQFRVLNAPFGRFSREFPRLETTMNRSREHMNGQMNGLATGQQPEASARALSATAISGPGLLLALRLIRP